MSSAARAIYLPSVPEVINIESLLGPIPGQSPVGKNLQEAGLHDEIREARREEEKLEQGEWVRELKTADWSLVVSLATDALVAQTKDLSVCAWLNEALVKMYGFAGLRDGLRLMRGLIERFWDDVYPEIDEGDLEARANTLAWMDRELAIPIKQIQITQTPTGMNYSYLLWEEEAAENPEGSDEWRKAKGATGRAFYEQIYGVLGECWSEFQALDLMMDSKFDQHTPGLGAIKKSLEGVRSLVEKIVKEKRILEPDPVFTVEEISDNRPTAQVSDAGNSSRVTGPIRKREDAIRCLSDVADFFRQTEPHSPISYLIERAIRWGHMPLEAWLEDVIKDGSVLEHLRDTLGLGDRQ